MAILHHQRIVPDISASSSEAGYPASNLHLLSVRRPWKGSGTITLDFTNPTYVYSVVFYGGTGIYGTTQDIEFDDVAVLNQIVKVEDNLGNFKGVLLVQDTITTIDIDVGVSTVELGSINVFTSAIDLGRNPLSDGIGIDNVYPSTENVLANGRKIISNIGQPYHGIQLDFEYLPSTDLYSQIYSIINFEERLFIDLEFRDYWWLVTCDSTNVSDRISNRLSNRSSFQLRELV